MFHVSILKKCISDLVSILHLEGLRVNGNIFYEEVLIEILDRQVNKLRDKEVSFVKVIWRNHLDEGAILEGEDYMKSRYLHLFPI